MPVIKIKWFTRELVQQNPTWLWVFGDNLAGVGLGGQAGACRGEPNAVGIPTKRAPGMDDASFFTDADLTLARFAIMARMVPLLDHLEAGGTVVLPEDGVGTGLAQLPERAPAIHAYIQETLETMERSFA